MAVSLNGIADLEGIFAEEIVHVVARNGRRSRVDYWR